MAPIIQCGKVTKNFWFILAMPIFYTCRAFISTARNLSNFPEHKSPFFFAVFSAFAYLFAGIFEIISYQLRKKTHNTTNSNNYNHNPNSSFIEIIKSEYIKMSFSEAIIYYLNLLSIAMLLTFIFAFAILLTHYAGNPSLYNTMRIGLLVFDLILSKIILKLPIHRHQLIAIITITIGLIMVSYEFLATEWVPTCLCILMYLFYALLDIQIKRNSKNMYHSIYKMMFIIGTMMIVLYIILFAIISFIPCESETRMFPCNDGIIEDAFKTFSTYFLEDSFYRIGMMIAFVLAHFGYSIFLFLIVHHFSPLHRCMSDMISIFLLWILELCLSKVEFQAVIMIGFIIIVLSCVIFNEVIILNFCSFEENTIKEIDIRSEFEQKILVENIKVTEDRFY